MEVPCVTEKAKHFVFVMLELKTGLLGMNN